jgi:uncharacterized protein YdiU (UPF0061 family)
MKTKLGLAVLAVMTFLPLRAFAADPGEKHVKLFEGFTDIVDQDKGDCDKMAADLNKYFDDHKAEIEKQKAEGAKMTEAQRKEFAEKYRDRFRAASEKMRGGMMACHANPKVQAMMKRMHDESGAGMHAGPGMHGGMHE